MYLYTEAVTMNTLSTDIDFPSIEIPQEGSTSPAPQHTNACRDTEDVVSAAIIPFELKLIFGNRQRVSCPTVTVPSITRSSDAISDKDFPAMSPRGDTKPLESLPNTIFSSSEFPRVIELLKGSISTAHDGSSPLTLTEKQQILQNGIQESSRSNSKDFSRMMEGLLRNSALSVATKGMMLIVLCHSFFSHHGFPDARELDCFRLENPNIEAEITCLVKLLHSACSDCLALNFVPLRFIILLLAHQMKRSLEQSCSIIKIVDILLQVKPRKKLTGNFQDNCCYDHFFFKEFLPSKVTFDELIDDGAITYIAASLFQMVSRREPSVRKAGLTCFKTLLEYEVPKDCQRIMKGFLKKFLRNFTVENLELFIDLFLCSDDTGEDSIEFFSNHAHSASNTYRKKLAHHLIKRLLEVSDKAKIYFYCYLVRYWDETKTDFVFSCLNSKLIGEKLKIYEFNVENSGQLAFRHFLVQQAHFFIGLVKAMGAKSHHLKSFITCAIEKYAIFSKFMGKIIGILFEILSEDPKNSKDVLETMVIVAVRNEDEIFRHYSTIKEVLLSDQEDLILRGLALCLTALRSNTVYLNSPLSLAKVLLNLVLRGSEAVVILAWNCLDLLIDKDEKVIKACIAVNSKMLHELYACQSSNTQITKGYQRYLTSLANACQLSSNCGISRQEFEDLIVSLWKSPQVSSKTMIYAALILYLRQNPTSLFKSSISEIISKILEMDDNELISQTVSLIEISIRQLELADGHGEIDTASHFTAFSHTLLPSLVTLVRYSRKEVSLPVIRLMSRLLNSGYCPPYVVLPVILGAWGSRWEELEDTFRYCYKRHVDYFLSSLPTTLRCSFRFFQNVMPDDGISPLQPIFDEETRVDRRLHYLESLIHESNMIGSNEVEYSEFIENTIRNLSLKSDAEISWKLRAGLTK